MDILRNDYVAKIADQYRKVVVTLDEIRFPNNNGIEHLFPWEFSAIL